MAKKTKKPNMPDSTLRLHRAVTKRLAALERRVDALERKPDAPVEAPPHANPERSDV